MAIYGSWSPYRAGKSARWNASRVYFGPKYPKSRSGKRKANAESRAARQQRDSTTVTLNRITSFPIEIGVGAQSNGIAIAHWNQLRLSTYFTNYAPMFDQIKIDKIKVKVVGSQAAASQTASISPTVVMAFDRNGLNVGQNLTPAAISTYSSSQMKNWSLGNAFTMYQTIYPSTIMEKGQYIPTESLLNPSDDDSSSNPCTSISDPSLPFKPITLIGVNTGINQTAVQTYVFSMEFEYTVTFRGMRKPSLAYLDLVPFTSRITENGRYRLTAEQADVPGWDSLDIVVSVPPDRSDYVMAYLDISASITDASSPSAIVLGTGASQVSLPSGSSLLMLTYYSGYYHLRFNRNLTQTVETINVPADPHFVYISPTTNVYGNILNSEGVVILSLTDQNSIDSQGSTLYLPSALFSVVNQGGQ